MKSTGLVASAVLNLVLSGAAAAASPAAEYAQHFTALSQLSVAVAQAMPADQYSFRPHAESMTFGTLMMHISSTNYAFCAGLNDADPPADPSISAIDKDAVVKFLSDSFAYCSGIIPKLSEAQLSQSLNSPDGRLPGERFCWRCMYTWPTIGARRKSIFATRESGRRPIESEVVSLEVPRRLR